MFQHLRYRSARVETHSAAGEQAEQKLMLNDADSFEYRKLVLGLIAMVEEKKDVLRETIVAIGRQTPADPEQQRTLEREKRSAQDQLQEVESYLLRLTGGVLTLDEA